ncbi:hypothetical protein ACE0DR_13740 [Azotobacter sp. CWF10]
MRHIVGGLVDGWRQRDSLHHANPGGGLLPAFILGRGLQLPEQFRQQGHGQPLAPAPIPHTHV